MTEFRKVRLAMLVPLAELLHPPIFLQILWMDADTLVLKNVDHLLKEDMLTSALTYNCMSEK
jgi:hypothetical protein